jgi:NAD(P)-dependent dehydrogenase (short-subunit alcohol dehydrogenase family)
MSFVLVTGGNRGLGRATAEALLREGHRVRITARSTAKLDEAVAALGALGEVEGRTLDLGSLADVRRFSAELLEERPPLDALLNNAGVMQQSPTRRVTADGFEETLGVNVIGPWLLTTSILPLLEGARVINVSSRLHIPGARPGARGPDFDFDDPQLERGYAHERAYMNSKLCLMWFTYELARRQPEITASAVCPGFVPTTGAESTRGFLRFMMKHVLPHMPFATSVKEAAANQAWACTSPDVETARFYTERAAVPSSDESYDEDKAARLWSMLEAWTTT